MSQGWRANEARQAGTLAIPFVKELTAQVPGEAARYVHFGATSQDVIDTAVVVCLKEAAHRVLVLARRLGDAAARLADRHRDTPTVARTLLQPATPVPFGWKAAVWLSLVASSYRQFRAAADDACVLQFGGPAGTLAAFGSDGEVVSTRLAGAARAQEAAHPLAQRARSLRPLRRRSRDPCRCRRKDRARRFAADAAGSWRSVRARKAPVAAAHPPCRTSATRRPACSRWKLLSALLRLRPA